MCRRVDVETTGHRHETRADYTIEADRTTGRITAASFTLDVNAGMSSDLSLAWVDVLMRRIDGGYTLPGFSGRGTAWRTNLGTVTAV